MDELISAGHQMVPSRPGMPPGRCGQGLTSAANPYSHLSAKDKQTSYQMTCESMRMILAVEELTDLISASNGPIQVGNAT